MFVSQGAGGPLVIVSKAAGIEHLDDGRDRRGGHHDQVLYVTDYELSVRVRYQWHVRSSHFHVHQVAPMSVTNVLND